MSNLKISDINNTGDVKTSPIIQVEKKKTVSELFLEECDSEEAKIFNEIKATLMNKCNKHEFEAVTNENLNGYATMITYIKNGIITIEEDGVKTKLRKPLINSDNNILANEIKILFERNEDRERQYRKSLNLNPKSSDYDERMGIAVITASFDKANVFLGVDSTLLLKKTNYNDYILLLSVYTFFRS